MIRAPEEPGRVALKFPVYVPSASRIVSPGETVVSADLSWAAVLTSMTAAFAVPAPARVRPPAVRAAASRTVRGSGCAWGCLPVGVSGCSRAESGYTLAWFLYMNVRRVSEPVAR